MSKCTIFYTISKLEPCVEDPTLRNNSGLYAGKYSNERYYWVQDPNRDPPSFPEAYNNKAIWESIIKEDTAKLDLSIQRLVPLSNR